MTDTLKTVLIDEIDPAPDNLRSTFTGIDDLAKSIEAYGLIEPIRLTKHEGRYRILAGHRRFEAIVSLGWTEVKAVVQSGKVDDSDRTAVMIIENMQRVDLTPLEEAEGVRRLVQEHGLTQASVAEALGTSRAWVKDRLALLNVPEYVFTTPKHAGTDKTLNVESLVKLGNLPDDVRDRLLKDGKVPSEYDIDDRMQKVKAEAQVEKEYKALVKRGVLAVTEAELKRIMKAELADLDGKDMMVKLKVGEAEAVEEKSWRAPTVPTMVLHYTHPEKPEDFTLDNVYVTKKAGGFARWYQAEYVDVNVQSEDEEQSEYDRLCDEIDARNDQRQADYDLAVAEALDTYVNDTKAAELTRDIVMYLISKEVNGFRGSNVCQSVAELLHLELVNIPEQGENEADDTYRQRVNDTKAEWKVQIMDHAAKNGTTMIRTLAAIHAPHSFDHGIERAEMEDYPEMTEDISPLEAGV